MKVSCLLIVALLFSTVSVLSQQNPDVITKEQARKEVEELKKEIANTEKELAKAKKSDPEEAAAIQVELDMMKKLLVEAEKALQALSKVSDQKIQQIQEDEAREVPRRQADRIAKLPKSILSDAELKTMLQQIQARVEKTLSPEDKKLADLAATEARKKNSAARGLATAGYGFWVVGKPQAALYMMGMACAEDYGHPDHLNNYAAFLTMCGAEDVGLPIALKLDAQYPKNSTVLNNIGQAWFGLGEVTTAEKYLDSAIALFSYHSQANFTKCLLQEARGDKAGAIQSLKRSMKYAYSAVKEDRLKKLGGELTNKELNWNFRMPQDPLGLHRFIPPKYAKTVEEAEALAPQWEALRENCWNAERILEEKIRALDASIQKSGEDKAKRAMQLVSKGINPMQLVLPPFFSKAKKKLELEIKDLDGQSAWAHERLSQTMAALQAKLDRSKKKFEDEMKAISTKYADRFGEGRDNPQEQLCADQTKARNKYLNETNTLLEQEQNAYVEYIRKSTNATVYFAQYMSPDDLSFEAAKMGAKKGFLSTLRTLRHTEEFPCDKKVAKPSGKLADFDDINCSKEIKLNMVFVKATFTCNKSSLQYDAFIVKGTHTENLNTGNIIGGTIEIGMSKSVGERELGPVKAEAKIGGGAFVEYGNDGITDIGVKAEMGLEVGTSSAVTGALGGPSVEIGVESRWGWNAGGSLSGKGILAN